MAGLQPVDIPGIENILCDEVKGHVQWRGFVGKYLQMCGADGVQPEAVEEQLRNVAERIREETERLEQTGTEEEKPPR